MFAGLAHNVGSSWCGVINALSSGDHFRRRYQTARGRLSPRRGPLPKLLWADLLLLLLLLGRLIRRNCIALDSNRFLS